MKNINRMTDLEMLEELYELKNRIMPGSANCLKQNGHYTQKQEQHDKNMQRYNSLKQNINISNINFTIDAATLNQALKKFLWEHLREHVQLFIRPYKDSKYLTMFCSYPPIDIMAVDKNVSSLKDLKIDLYSFISDEENCPICKGLNEISKIYNLKNLHKVLFAALKACQPIKVIKNV